MNQKLKLDKISPIKAVGYLRVSTEEQEEGFSLRMQKEKLKAFAKSQDYLLVKLYQDVNSGQKMEREGVKLMLKELDELSVKLILLYKLDRLSRKLKDVLVLVSDVLQPKGVGLRSVTESFDTMSPQGRAMLQMLGCFAEFEGAMLGERLRDCRLKAAKLRYGGGGIPYGYTTKDKILVVEEKEAQVLRKMRRLRQNSHLSFSQIAKVLNEEGIPTRRGKKWYARTVFDILRRTIYRTGRYKYGTAVHGVSRIA